jgi:hypothetical protein
MIEMQSRGEPMPTELINYNMEVLHDGLHQPPGRSAKTSSCETFVSRLRLRRCATGSASSRHAIQRPVAGRRPGPRLVPSWPKLSRWHRWEWARRLSKQSGSVSATPCRPFQAGHRPKRSHPDHLVRQAALVRIIGCPVVNRSTP